MNAVDHPTSEQLGRFVQGQLALDEVSRFEAHLEGCPTCCLALADTVHTSHDDAFVSRLRQVEARPSTEAARVPAPTALVPGYEILGELGRGASGVVYRARQIGLNRPVALKVLISGGHAGPEELVRFRKEAEAVARVQHVNVIQTYEFNAQGSPPFLALEYVEGGTLAARVRGQPQPPREAASLVAALARGTHAAHQEGIIHRDLKPGNVLLDRAGTPKIADFGLARWLEDERGLTMTGDVAGTASYMAPEQARGARGAISAATDVYALGAILYELLTGRPPFRGTNTGDTLIQVLTEEAVPPQRLQPSVPRDLETVCLKCLDKDARRRYPTAQALAEDLERFLGGQPIQARPIGPLERGWKAARRHPGVAALSVLTFVVAAVGVSLVTWKWREAEANARSEAAARRESERLLAGVTLDKAVNLCETGEIAQGLLWLVRTIEIADRAGDEELARIARTNLSSWREFFVRPRAALPHRDWIWDIAFSPDGRLALTGSRDRTARLWDAVSGQPARTVDGVEIPALQHELPVWCVVFSPDGKTILTGSAAADGTKSEARLWQTATGQPIGKPTPVDGFLRSVAFDAAGTRLLIVGRRATLWSWQPDFVREGELAHEVRAARFSPDGQRVATAGSDGAVRLFSSDTRAPIGQPLEHAGPVHLLAFSPDGQTLASACQLNESKGLRGSAGQVWLWDLTTGKPRGQLAPMPGPIKDLCFNRAGSLLATAGLAVPADPRKQENLLGEARIWDVTSLQPATPVMAHSFPVWSVAFSPDGRWLLTGCEDRRAHLWLAATGMATGRSIQQGDLVRAVTFSADGRLALLASAGENARAQIIEMPEVSLLRSLPHAETTYRLYADARSLLVTSKQRSQLWDLQSLTPRGQPLTHSYFVMSAVFTDAGSRLWTANGVTGIQSWDTATGKALTEPVPLEADVESVVLSRDARLLVHGSRGDSRVFDVRRQAWRPELYGGTDDALDATFLPDGCSFYAGGRRLIHWQVGNTQPLSRTPAPEDVVERMTLSPDGRRLVTWGKTHRAHQWDAASGKALGAFFPSKVWLSDVAIAADNRTVLVGERGGQARLWDLPSGKPLSAPLPHAGEVYGALTASHLFVAAGPRVHVWRIPVPWPGTTAQVRQEIEALTHMALDDADNLQVRP